MKKHFKNPFILLLLLIVALGSCSSDEDPGVEQIKIEELSAGQLQAMVDGERKSAETVAAVLTDDSFTLAILFKDNSALTITVDTLEEGSKNITMAAQGHAEYVVDTDDPDAGVFSSVNGEGSISFQQIDADQNTFSGSFSFSLVNPNDETQTVEISSGAFNAITYVVDAQQPGNGTFTATVDGQSWSAETITAKLVSQVGVLDIKGHTESDIDIDIYMPADITAGVYNFTGNGDYVGIVYPAGENVGTHFSSSGELTIINHDADARTIEGEFYFEGTRMGDSKRYSITDGAFKVSY